MTTEQADPGVRNFRIDKIDGPVPHWHVLVEVNEGEWSHCANLNGSNDSMAVKLCLMDGTCVHEFESGFVADEVIKHMREHTRIQPSELPPNRMEDEMFEKYAEATIEPLVKLACVLDKEGICSRVFLTSFAEVINLGTFTDKEMKELRDTVLEALDTMRLKLKRDRDRRNSLEQALSAIFGMRGGKAH